MQQQLDWAKGKPNEYVSLFWQANTAAYQGQLRIARELSQRGVDAQLSRNLKENAANEISLNASTAAAVGNCQQVREDVARASALPRTTSLFPELALRWLYVANSGRRGLLRMNPPKSFPKILW